MRLADGTDLDVRLISVSEGPDTGVWINESVERMAGQPVIEGDPLAGLKGKALIQVRTALERSAGKVQVLKAKIKAKAKVQADVALRQADDQKWTELLMLCIAEVEGYEMTEL